MRGKSGWLPFGVALVLCFVHTVAHGEAGQFSLSGFGTLGLARSSSDHAQFLRDLSQPEGLSGGRWSGRIDSIFGVQASWQPTAELEFVGQAVSRLRYDGTRDPELMWAYGKWEPDARVSLRAGRLGADFMMLADSRLVGYSFLTVRPPADFFGPLFFSHFDGADASLSVPLGAGIVRSKLFAGATQEKAIGTPGVWDTRGSPVRGAVVDYMEGAWLLRANYAQITFADNINFWPLITGLNGFGANAAANLLLTKDKTARFYSVGAVYDQGPLQVQMMLNRITQESAVFQNSHAGYLLAGYRVGTVTPFAGVSWWKTKYKNHSTGLPSPAFDALNVPFRTIMAASGADQNTYTLGARLDVLTNVALKLQWDAIRGDAGSVFPFARTEAGWSGRTHVISATMDFVF